MKPFRTLQVIAAFSLTVVACTSGLELTSPTQLSNATFWTQESDAVLSLNAVYSGIPGANTVLEMDGITDNGTVNRQYDGRYVYTDGSYDPQSGFSRGYWNGAYSGITRANILLANIDKIPAAKIDPARKARYQAETRFLRAYYYTYLTNLFGDVPLILEPLTIDAARNVTRAPVAQVVDKILSELDAAAAVLPASYSAADNGRATKGAALALKARAALYAGRYAVAAAAAKAVIDMGGYALNASYSGLFSYAGVNSKEIIFVRNYAKTEVAPGQNSGIFGTFGPPTSSGAGLIVPIRSLVDSYQASDGKPISGPDASPLYDSDPLKMYNNRDPRLAATVLYPGALWDGKVYDSRPKPLSKTPEAIDPQSDITPVTGYNIRKGIDLADKADRGNGALPAILIRYADVLLMYAEAKIELGQLDASVTDAINQVRQRVGMPAIVLGSQSQMRDAVRYERRAELAFEGLRLYDIRRWKIGEQVMPTPKVKGIDYFDAGGVVRTILVPASARSFFPRNYLWPVPQSEIDINPKLGQNPGY